MGISGMLQSTFTPDNGQGMPNQLRLFTECILAQGTEGDNSREKMLTSSPSNQKECSRDQTIDLNGEQRMHPDKDAQVTFMVGRAHSLGAAIRQDWSVTV